MRGPLPFHRPPRPHTLETHFGETLRLHGIQTENPLFHHHALFLQSMGERGIKEHFESNISIWTLY